MHPQVEWSKPPSDRTSHTQSKILWLRIKISLDMKLGSMHARIADFCILRASMPGIAWLAEGDKLDKVNQKCHASVLQNSIQTQVDTSEAGCTERGGATLGTLWWIWHWATCVLWECLLLKGVLKNNLKRLGWLKRAFCKTFSSSYWNNTLKLRLFAQSWNSVILLCALKLLFQAVRICWHNQVYFRDLAKSSTMFQCKLSLNSLDPFIAFRDIAQLLGIHRTNPINLKDYIVFKVQGPNCYSKGGSTQDVCIGKSLNLSRVIAWLVSLLWISAKHAVWLFNWLPNVYWICSDVAFLDISGVLMRLGPENLILCSKMLRQKIWLGSELKLQIASPEWSSVSSKRKTARWINFWFATFGQSAKNWRSNDREMVWA